MAFTFGFYNSMRGDRKYNADQVGALFDGLLNDGVYASIGEIFATVPGEGMSVVVKTGRAWFNRTWNENNSHMILTLSESNVLLPRFDAVVLEVDKRDTVRQNRILIVEGTPSANPVHPNLINNAEVGFFQHPLAYVKVDPNVIAIAPDKIQIMVGTNECPFVTGILRLSSIDDLYQGWEYQFQEWWKGIKALLNENTVGRLQAQIDERVKYTDKVDVNNLSQILSDENNRWMTPASTKKAILATAYPIGTTVLPGQAPAGTGNWVSLNGGYASLPNGPVKNHFAALYGYRPQFYTVLHRGGWRRCAYDRKNGAEAALGDLNNDGGRMLYLSNINWGHWTEDSNIDQTAFFIAYIDGVLGILNSSGSFSFGGKVAVINSTMYGIMSMLSDDFKRLHFMYQTSNYNCEMATVTSDGLVTARVTIPGFINSTSHNAVYRMNRYAPIKLSNGHACFVGKSNENPNNVIVCDADARTWQEIPASSADPVANLVWSVISSENYLKDREDGIIPSSDYNDVYINYNIITNKNGGALLKASAYESDLGLQGLSLRGRTLSGDMSSRSLYTSMGVANKIAPKQIVYHTNAGYSGGYGSYVCAGHLYGSNHTDGSFQLVDGSDSSIGVSNFNSFRGDGDRCPTMSCWEQYSRIDGTHFDYTLYITKDDPSKVRVPLDPAGAIMKY